MAHDDLNFPAHQRDYDASANSSIIASRILNFWILPVTVIG
jgi:hypothetical protein